MKRLLLLMLAVMVGWLPAVAQAWWQPDWQYRKQISVDTTPEGGAISENVGRTPLLVRLHTGNFSFDGTNENGSDLRFVSGDDQTVLNHQIESFDPLMGMALIWVDIPEVMASQKQDIWMYYGNEKAPVASNGQITFDPNYTLVYHFDGAAGAPSRDSTAYTNHAQTAPAGVTDGVSGRAAQFVGAAPLMLPASPSLAVPAAGAFSFSAWVRADQPQAQQLVYARRDGANSFLIGLDQGVPFVEINGQRSPAGAPLSPNTWQHLAVTADGSQVILYVQGRATASLNASLPPLNTVAALGADVPGAVLATPVAPAAETATAEGATAGAAAAPALAVTESVAPAAVPATQYAPFVGAIDELRLSKIARPAALIYADALAQGAESRLVAYGVDEEQSGFGFGALGFLLKAVPMDAWIVIAVLVFMMFQSWVIMYRKSRQVGRVQEANRQFRDAFGESGGKLDAVQTDAKAEQNFAHSSLWRLYRMGVKELHNRQAQGMKALSPNSIEAIRASMDGVRTQENQALGARLGILSNAIAGGPYIGLLGTVLGIMVVFLGTAMAGDVNINAIAPGMAAALLATAMGLFVAIPALFGYNRLVGRNKEVSADMRVFVDEFVTRLAEVHGQNTAAPKSKHDKHETALAQGADLDLANAQAAGSA
ncbi:MotA/TolQ/ExbB proton channel family protein [Providencia rettgeri]|nr:MotA/TolQ/ExbB proton channel family protein [Providencia rettgeri]